MMALQHDIHKKLAIRLLSSRERPSPSQLQKMHRAHGTAIDVSIRGEHKQDLGDDLEQADNDCSVLGF